jgi:hypothetical protein
MIGAARMSHEKLGPHNFAVEQNSGSRALARGGSPWR